MSRSIGALLAAVGVGVLIGHVWRGMGSHALPAEYYSDPIEVVSKKVTVAAAAAHGKRVVLLTGAAGFVGFHTALQLHSEGDIVLGLDNFNHYYDVRLKEKRAALLKRAGMHGLIQGDVCDGELLKLMLRAGRVTHVIHLAAQAGVRYSLKKPLAYVEANVKCFVRLLEAVNAVNKSVPITYASSSSVYGTNTLIPFSESHRVDSQASLYARL